MKNFFKYIIIFIIIFTSSNFIISNNIKKELIIMSIVSVSLMIVFDMIFPSVKIIELQKK